MPSSITHELIAREAPLGDARAAVDAAPDYYYLGAQGPDLFFFLRPLNKKEYNLGKTLHRGSVYEWFSALKDALKTRTGDARDKCLAYALGFCSHLSADVAFHPFVYNYLRENNSPRRVHQIMENDWDVYFLRKLKNGSVWKYAFPFDLKKIDRDGILFAYLRDAAEALHRRPITKRAFHAMMRNFRLYLNYFHRGKGKGWQRFDRLFRIYGLSSFFPHETPLDGVLGGDRFAELSENRGEDADALFRLAARESAERIEIFYACVLGGDPLPRSPFSRHMLTGKEI